MKAKDKMATGKGGEDLFGNRTGKDGRRKLSGSLREDDGPGKSEPQSSSILLTGHGLLDCGGNRQTGFHNPIPRRRRRLQRAREA